MTEERKKIIIRYHYIVVCILMGLLVLGGVFVGSIQTDLNTAEKHFRIPSAISKSSAPATTT